MEKITVHFKYKGSLMKLLSRLRNGHMAVF